MDDEKIDPREPFIHAGQDEEEHEPKYNGAVHQAMVTLLREATAGRTSRERYVKAISFALNHEHRTIQQMFWSAILLAQIEYATEPFDLRNEAAVRLANRVKDLAKSMNYDLGLPNI